MESADQKANTIEFLPPIVSEGGVSLTAIARIQDMDCVFTATLSAEALRTISEDKALDMLRTRMLCLGDHVVERRREQRTVTPIHIPLEPTP